MKNSDKKPVGKTKDVGYQVGARKTLPVTSDKAWDYLTSGKGLSIWLGETSIQSLSKGTRFQLDDGTTGKVRVFSDSHLRMSWHPPQWNRPSTIQLRVIPRDDRSVIAFHQEHLPGPEEREERREFFRSVLDRLTRIFT